MEQNCRHPPRTDQSPRRHHSRQRHQLYWTLALGNDLLDMVIAGYHLVPVVVHLQPRDLLYLVYKLFRKFQKKMNDIFTYFDGMHSNWNSSLEVKFSVFHEPGIRFFPSGSHKWAFYNKKYSMRFISMLG